MCRDACDHGSPAATRRAMYSTIVSSTSSRDSAGVGAGAAKKRWSHPARSQGW
jgi:hypothetical protein